MVSHVAANILCLAVLGAAPSDPAGYFKIAVVDDDTGRGVPLVELRTVQETRHVTDSGGIVAFYEPGMMDSEVFFHVSSHGYEFPADGIGFRGRAFKVAAGQSAELRIKRLNIAERLYRVTGAGIYRDTLLVGGEAPIRQPLLNAQVVGSDSVNTAVFGGQVHWFWGDTNRASYPLGNFHVPGATSKLPAAGGLDPARGVDLDYFVREDGFAASTAEMPGDGPTWIDGLCVVREGQRERMFAKYVKVRKELEVYERGLVEFNAETKRFEKRAQYDFAAPLYPLGHALHHAQGGVDYLFFGNPYPTVRVAAKAEALADPGQFETYTCLSPRSSLDKLIMDRDSEGRVRYGWKRGTAAATAADQAKWIKQRLLNDSEATLALRDVESGRPVIAHAGSVAYNDYRRRYVMIAEEIGGSSSYLGEIWYAEADTPLGPWVYARKVVTHDKYSFYNPKRHAMFDQQGGRKIFFEGTYSTTFSDAPRATPRYDYNQIMYALDLGDPRLALPVCVRQQIVDGRQRLVTGPPAGDAPILFMAPDRPLKGGLAISRRATANGAHEWIAQPASEVQGLDGVAFYALPADGAEPPAGSVLLHAWSGPGGDSLLLVDPQQGPAGYRRAARALCRVWRFPLSAAIAWQ